MEEHGSALCAPELPVLRAVLYRLRDMRALNVGACAEVRDGSGDFEEAECAAKRTRFVTVSVHPSDSALSECFSADLAV